MSLDLGRLKVGDEYVAPVVERVSGDGVAELAGTPNGTNNSGGSGGGTGVVGGIGSTTREDTNTVQFEDVQAALTHDLFGPGGQAEKKKKGWQRRRSGTAFNRAPPPESSDEDEDEGGGEHQVRFQADPASQSPSRMPRRARSGTAFNRAPPPPEDNEEEYDAVSSSADSTESSDDEDGDQGNTDKGGSSIAAQPSDAVQRTLPRIGSRLFNNAFA
jgi:hypothetical protein